MNSIGQAKTMAEGGSDARGELRPGDMLGPYRTVRLLGRGGMGEVYLVEHGILTTRHALKLLPRERSGRAGFVDRFHDEARVMATLTHPGIVRVTNADVGEGGRHYLVMDFVAADGGETPFDLADALSEAPEGRLPPETVARLAGQICEAVHAAHEKGVVHRDLKPANVLLTSRDFEQAEARVADFGLARLLGEDWVRSRADESMRRSPSLGDAETAGGKGRTSDNAILGTYEYMSPEQRAGSDAVGPRSDIFSLGVMLYRMITGRALVGRAKAASKIVEGLSVEWDLLIDACLEEDPEDRPASMGEVTAGLEVLRLAEVDRREAEARERERQRRRAEEAERQRREEEARIEAARREAARQRAEKERERQAQERKRRAQEAAEQARREAEGQTKREGRGRRRGVVAAVLGAVLASAMGAVTYMSHKSHTSHRQQPPPRGVRREPGISPAPGTTTAGPEPGRPWAVPVLGMAFMPVSAGTFKMGAEDRDADDDEKPVHDVRITRDFWMGKYEVTQAEYEALMGENPSRFKGARNPVEMVSWEDATAFCAKLSERERKAGRLPAGYEYRLPTEAEWEYCCRAGATGRFCFGDDESRLKEYANYEDTPVYEDEKTAPVGRFKPNAWGLYDMHGNVWEWCLDWYDSDYYERTNGASDPVNLQKAANRVKRGGSWDLSAGDVRSANRNRNRPSNRYFNLGFRVCLARGVR